MRNELLDLHRALFEAEKRRYERDHGRVGAGRALELALEHPQFAWMRPLSLAIAALDELDDLMKSPRYRELLQQEPDVVLAHGRLAKLLAEAKKPAR